MIKRNILVVDDDIDINLTIETYKVILKKISQYDNQWNKYELSFDSVNSISEALSRLSKKSVIYDVILIDYDFPSELSKNIKGIELVKEIRNSINKRCKIVFYTMSGLKEFEKIELIDLINNDVFRFVSKSGEGGSLKYERVGPFADQLIVEALLDSLQEVDPVVTALERYFNKYSAVSDNMRIKIEGKEYKVEEILNSIRLDTDLGNLFINNIFKIAILDCIKFLD